MLGRCSVLTERRNSFHENDTSFYVSLYIVFTYHFHIFQIVEGKEVAYQVLHANITHLSCSMSLLSASCNDKESLEAPQSIALLLCLNCSVYPFRHIAWDIGVTNTC